MVLFKTLRGKPLAFLMDSCSFMSPGDWKQTCEPVFHQQTLGTVLLMKWTPVFINIRDGDGLIWLNACPPQHLQELAKSYFMQVFLKYRMNLNGFRVFSPAEERAHDFCVSQAASRVQAAHVLSLVWLNADLHSSRGAAGRPDHYRLLMRVYLIRCSRMWSASSMKSLWCYVIISAFFSLNMIIFT